MALGLVLGGGGPLGTAWYAGLGQGLAASGIDFAAFDVVIGTSAGAVAGAWWASGEPPSKFTESLVRRFEDPAAIALAERLAVDAERLGRIYGVLGQAVRPLDARSSQRICEDALAMSPPGGDEDWNVRSTAPHLPQRWPERFRAVVVRARDGNVRVLGPDDGIELARGVAASAAAPGLTSAVRIGADLYFDGGARSATNADLVCDLVLDRCLVISPVPADAPLIGPATERMLDYEVRQLRDAGTAVATLLPGELEAAAFGSNLMDRSKLHQAIEAGIRRGQCEAGNLIYE